MQEIATRIRKQIVAAAADFDMLSADDRVMVAVSGGKDSSVLLWQLNEIRQRAPFPFSLHPVILDQKQPGFSVEKYAGWIESRVGLKLHVIEEDTYSIVKQKIEPGKSFCGLCSRLRRGVLYNFAHAHGYTKIALGHHRDDLNQTLLMNLFFNGSVAAMPPKLLSDDERNVVIRPLAYVAESDIQQLATELEIPTIPCNLCGSQDNLQRQKIKDLIATLRKDIPAIDASLQAAQQNVRLSQLSDRELRDFAGLQIRPRHTAETTTDCSPQFGVGAESTLA